MAKMLILVLSFFCFLLNVEANDIILSKTGNPQLDGTYKPFIELNGAMSFIKNTEGITFKIARFKWSVNQREEAFGWLISDSNGKEYFAVTDQSTQIPSQGWDVARAGVGLNAYFDLTVKDGTSVQGNALTLSNTLASDVKVYPNPTRGEIVVDAKEMVQTLFLTNVTGQVLISQQSNRLDLSNLPNGIYNLTIQTTGEKTVRRIVKQ